MSEPSVPSVDWGLQDALLPFSEMVDGAARADAERDALHPAFRDLAGSAAAQAYAPYVLGGEAEGGDFARVRRALQVPDPDDNPWVDGFVTFCSFVFFGTIPLLGYACLYTLQLTATTLFGIAVALTAITLFLLGVLKAKFSRPERLVA